MEKHGRPEKHIAVLVTSLLLLAVLICAAFSASGAALVSGAALWTGSTAEPDFIGRSLIKAALFAILAAGAGWGLWHTAKRLPASAPEPAAPPTPGTRATWILLAAALVATSILVLPNLDKSPKAEPDETHHLIVARNLAQYGLYASGHPDTGFVIFDDYDSVGPPVIVPLAGTVRLAGNHLGRARLVMAGFFLAFCVAAFYFLHPVFGSQAAGAGLVLAVLAKGSVYLGRSVYGEVPALLFLLLGLILWRRALTHRLGLLAGLAAGVAFCLAALCKYFIAMAFWPLLGALIYDRLAFRRIRWPHLLFPTIGALAAFGVWCLIRAVNTPESGDPAMAQFALYQHLILFGLKPFASTFPRLAYCRLFPICLCLVLLALPRIMRDSYDPPTVALLLFIPFILYWWLFFTPGHILRYLWYGFACAGMLAGPALWATIEAARRKASCAAILLLVLFVAVMDSRGGVRQVFADETRDHRALAAYVRELPPEASIATSSWPLKRLLNFMAGRNVSILRRAPHESDAFDVVVAEGQEQRALFEGRVPEAELGRFAVYVNKENKSGS